MVQSWTGGGFSPPTSPGPRGYIDANNLLCKRALIFRASRSIKIRIKGMNCVLPLERGDIETLETRCESTVLYPHMMIYIYNVYLCMMIILNVSHHLPYNTQTRTLWGSMGYLFDTQNDCLKSRNTNMNWSI